MQTGWFWHALPQRKPGASICISVDYSGFIELSLKSH